MQKGTASRVMVASRPKDFDQMAVPVMEIMDSSLYTFVSNVFLEVCI
jgi:hypothetical protein